MEHVRFYVTMAIIIIVGLAASGAIYSYRYQHCMELRNDVMYCDIYARVR